MRFSSFFLGFGWILAVTAGGLLPTPWRWHRRFGEWAVPLAIRYRKVFALSSLALGAFILYAIFAAF
ncbi:MAG TPA: hypothetical protein VLD67_17765 [Vicinamibacterales bacterium]|nr:hypothetical protein [Vicinamibacterales bacterium]